MKHEYEFESGELMGAMNAFITCIDHLYENFGFLSYDNKQRGWNLYLDTTRGELMRCLGTCTQMHATTQTLNDTQLLLISKLGVRMAKGYTPSTTSIDAIT